MRCDDVVGSDPSDEHVGDLLKVVEPALLAGPIAEFGSWSWLRLAPDDPCRGHAMVRAALGWWSARVFGAGVPADVLDREVAGRLAEVGPAVYGADRALWLRVARGRAIGIPVGKARSVYGPAAPLPEPPPELVAAFERAAKPEVLA